MTSALTVLNNTTALAVNQGGLGVNFGSKLFKLKPATLGIIQQNSQAEGKKGSLRISETGDVYSEMIVTLLDTPHPQRKCYNKSAGQLNRTFDDLICYSKDGITPDPRAKDIQAPFCAGCPQTSWDAWRVWKEEHNGIENKELRPACEEEYYAVVLDTKYRLPMQMFVKGKSTKTFEQGMQNLQRLFTMAEAQGKNPNIFDVKFTLKTKQITTGKFVSYVYDLSNFEFITPEERQAFGEIYLKYVSQVTATASTSQRPATSYEEDETNQGSSSTVATVVEPEYVNETITV